MSDDKLRCPVHASVIQIDNEPAIIGRVVFECPACGTFGYQIAGHHMRMLLKVLADWIEAYPDLTGPKDAILVNKEKFVIHNPGGDPTQN